MTFFLLDQTSEEGTPRELVVNIIDKVAHEGNKLGALGNAWLKPNKKLIDANSARDVLVLILPTKATESLEVLYENQIRTIEELEDKIVLPVPKVYVTLSMCLPLLTLLRRLLKSPTVFSQQTLEGHQLSSQCC